MAEQSSAEVQPAQTDQPGPITFAEFLESVSPNQQREIADLRQFDMILRGNVISGFSLALSASRY
jgi:hypothetical protein